MAVLSGRLRPWRGDVYFEGQPVVGRRPRDLARSGLCCIPVGGGLLQDLSVRDNLLLAGAGRAGNASVGEVYDLFPVLAERRSQRAGTLSGGEKRMLALSRAVLVRPTVLLVDEPSLGLAPIVVDEVFAVLRRLRDETATSIVLVEQYVERALDLADWAWVLTKGRVTYSGEAAGLAGSETLHAAYLGGSVAGRARRNGSRRRGN
jgi:branched-chain amino acid transport system ATP-binding protein